MKTRLLALLTAAFMVLLVACGGAEPEPTATPMAEAPVETPTEEPTEEPTAEAANTIADIAAGNEDFATLVAALEAAGLVDTLAGEGPFTVFAPTNAAFDNLPEGALEGLLATPEGDLTQILTYHVLEGEFMAADVVGLESATTIQGEEIEISVTGDTVMLNDSATVVTTDIEASNGVIHVIDAVILPPSIAAATDEETEMMDDNLLPTIAEIAVSDADFSTLVAALDEAGLLETLSGTDPFTVFAPTNAAFDALPEGTVEALLEDPAGDLTQILLYHVVPGEVFAVDVLNTESVTTAAGEDITITVEGDNVILNGDVMVTTTDIEAANGVIHVIDAVLIPPSIGGQEGADVDVTAEGTPQPGEELPTIAEVATEAGTFNTLLTALTEAGLADAFADPSFGPITVFAPTDDAFAALPEGTLEDLLADPEGALTNILRYHVVPGEVFAEDVMTLESAMTDLGEEITIEIDEDGNVILNGEVMVTATDIMASNGVIHVIDAVLIPPTE